MNADITYVLATANATALKHWRQATGSSQVHFCRSKTELIERLRELRPKQYFLDLSLPELNGVRDVHQLITDHPYSLCLAFSPVPQDNEGLDMLKAGVRAYCNRFIDTELLARISALVASGEVWIGHSLMEELIRRLPAPAMHGDSGMLDSLTEREMDIANRVGQGDSNKVIATALDISERTVKAHLTSIFQKTESKDRLQLALLIKAAQEG